MGNTPPKRSKALALSNLLFALMIVTAAVVAYLYFFDDRFFPGGPEAPACDTNSSELACVVAALRQQDFDHVDYGRYTVSSDQLSQPGQVVEINDLNGFVFVYPAASMEEGISMRKVDGEKIDPDTMRITARTSERPLNDGEDIFVVQHNNIIFILVGGSDSDNQKVQDAIESLP